MRGLFAAILVSSVLAAGGVSAQQASETTGASPARKAKQDCCRELGGFRYEASSNTCFMSPHTVGAGAWEQTFDMHVNLCASNKLAAQKRSAPQAQASIAPPTPAPSAVRQQAAPAPTQSSDTQRSALRSAEDTLAQERRKRELAEEKRQADERQRNAREAALQKEIAAERQKRQELEERLAAQRKLNQLPQVEVETKERLAAVSDPQSTPLPAPRRVALVIGNTRYQHAARLENPTNDADLMAAAFKTVGFQSVLMHKDLTQSQTFQALREFSALADNADWAVVYYSGHGIEFGGSNYLIPVEARLRSDRDIDLEAVDMGKVLSSIEGAKRLRLIVLDACRDNPFASQMRRTMASRSLGRGLARIEPEAGTLIAYAAKHGEVALDGNDKNSPYAAALAKRLQQRPSLEVRRLFDVVRDDVVAATSRKQQPFSYGSVSGSEEFFFAAR